MPQLTTQTPAKTVAESRSSRSGILIGGTLVVMIAGGIAMQVWRAQSTQAAEQKSDGSSATTRMDAQNTAWMSLMGFTPSDRARLGLQEIRVANELDQYRQRKSSVVYAEVVSEV